LPISSTDEFVVLFLEAKGMSVQAAAEAVAGAVAGIISAAS